MHADPPRSAAGWRLGLAALGAAVRVGVGMGGVEKLDEDDVVGGPLGGLVAYGMAGHLQFDLSAIVGVIGRGGAGSVRPRLLDGPMSEG